MSTNGELKLKWFENWHPALDDALNFIPEINVCPHELYHLIACNQSSSKKIFALVTSKKDPVAVIGLRQRGGLSWELMTQWIIPGFVFPSKPDYINPALEALSKDIWIAWWRMDRLPPQGELVRSKQSTPTHRMRLSENFEHYWRENGYFKTIRRMRNRCANFELKVNAPGAAELTIRRWMEEWADNPGIAPGLDDRILIANYFENLGRHFTLTLYDNETPIGSATMMAHEKDVVAGVIFRDHHYQKKGVGVRLIDLSFEFAANNGFDTFDIGGGQNYKEKWAPQEGENLLINVCPTTLFQIKQLTHNIRTTLKNKLK